MLKKEAIKLFSLPTDRRPVADGTARLSEALEITTNAIYMWPDDLPHKISDRVIGAALRLGIDISAFIEADAREAA